MKTLITIIASVVLSALVAVGIAYTLVPKAHVGAAYPTQLSAYPNGIQVGGGSYSQGFVQSGVNATSTATTTETLQSTDVIGYSAMFMTPTAGSLTLTLPSSSTMATWLPNLGDYTSFVIYNASTTAGVTITLAAGTGSFLETASTTAGATINPARGATVDVIRASSTLIYMVAPYF
jgi:hypothetical protein